MKTCLIPDSVRYRSMHTSELRESFLLESLSSPGEIRLAYVDVDRAVIGMASPAGSNLALPCPPELRASHFLERREVGALNIGGPGTIRADDKLFEVAPLDCVYLGRGTELVEFSSADLSNPAIFCLLSYLAHAEFPTTIVRRADASPTELGSAANANRRTVCKYIHQQGARSSQLVMGRNASPARQHLEHDASAYALATFGSLHVLQCRRE